MNRRDFLKRSGQAGAAVAVAPLPVAAVVTKPVTAAAVSLPVRGGNTLLTPEWVTKEAVRILREDLDRV